MTTYLMPAGFGEAGFTEKRSRFIGRVWPVETEAEALERLGQMREKHRDATHNVYAYILRENNITRYSDDGEPSGTSAMPALSVFAQEKIENFCCVITRYFGGTLLGTGGLTHAYSKAAKLALEAAGITQMAQWRQLAITVPYNFYDKTARILDAFEAAVEKTDFGAQVELFALVREDREQAFLKEMTESFSGRALIERRETRFCGVRIK